MKIAYISIALLIAFAGAYYANSKGIVSIPLLSSPTITQLVNKVQLPSQTQISSVTERIPTEQIPQEIGQTVSGIYSNAQEAGTVAEQVLGSAIQATNSSEPLHQRALEYAQYRYCQQIVQEWESNKTPAP